MSGPNLINQPGTYGTQGTVAAGNIPGARAYAAWTDASGNVWLFGGKGLDSTGAWGFLNDLWKYSGGQWTWMSGSNLVNQPGSYGTQGTPAPSNVPASRNGGVAWSDAAGNFWLFGGQGRDPSGPYVRLNDFWRYSGGQWTWMKGSNLSNQPGTWGTQGTPAPDNTPRARQYAVGWKDQNGNFWLFSGDAIASDGRLLPNDLWKYEP
jgi:N-acetylneuraminic acid mutarotase